MVLGNRQYSFPEENNVIPVVLIHHPLDWFVDETQASQMLQNRARVIMVGHEHTLNIQKTTDAFTKREWLVIYAGATNPPETGSSYDFTYNWIEFSCCETDGKHCLRVEVFPRVWVPQGVRFAAHRTRLGGPESTTIDICCPNVEPIPEKSKGEPGPPLEALPETSEASPIAPTAPPEDATIADKFGAHKPTGEAMDNESVGFDRLRYLFWRYLDWRQRLTVLVAVDALPETADQPVPQTLERVALEAARETGKLHDLWEEIMRLVPDEKQETNPFVAGDR
jgi:hypothetical protein